MPDPSDHRDQLVTAYEQAAALAEAIPTEALERPTPCAAFDLGTLLGHAVYAARRGVALGRGERLGSDDADSAGPIEPRLAAELLRQAAADAKLAWADDARLEARIEMPWGEVYSGAMLVDMYLLELVTHGWDIARASGQLERLDESLVPAAMACAKATIAEEYRGGEMPFGPIVEPPPDATAYEQLAAFMGRQPR